MYRRCISSILLALLGMAAPVQTLHAQTGGAACVMAKYQGKTLDYALVHGRSHPVAAQEEAEQLLRQKGYDKYKRNLDIIRPQNLSDLRHAVVVVIRSEFKDSLGRDRSVMGCGFDATSADEALWDAMRDAQSYFWGWKPDRDGYEVVQSVRY